MLASDQTIRDLLESGDIETRPQPTDDLIQPCSLDIHLDRFFRTINREVGIIDPAIEQPDLTVLHEVHDGEAFLLPPGGFVLASTLEWVRLSPRVAAQVDGRSSVGRLGILVHATAGWIDPGFRGHITLELFNLAPVAVKLYPGMRLAQLMFSVVASVNAPYGAVGRRSSYLDQRRGPVPSAMWRTWNPLKTKKEKS